MMKISSGLKKYFYRGAWVAQRPNPKDPEQPTHIGERSGEITFPDFRTYYTKLYGSRPFGIGERIKKQISRTKQKVQKWIQVQSADLC